MSPTGRCSPPASGTACWPCSTPGPAGSAPASPAGRASGSTTPARSGLTRSPRPIPGLTVVAAHFGWPWHMELVAMALHKTNVYIDISGWAPRRIPPELIGELRGRLAGQFVWGSDFPFLAPRAVPGRAGGPGPAGRGARQGAPRQRGPHPPPAPRRLTSSTPSHASRTASRHADERTSATQVKGGRDERQPIAQISARLKRGMAGHLPALGRPISRPDVMLAPDRLGLASSSQVNTRRISRAAVGSWWPWLEREL